MSKFVRWLVKFGLLFMAGPVCAQTLQTSNNLRPQNVNGVVYANMFPGSDIGAQINNAIANVSQCGKVIIPPGNYSFSTPIVKPRCVKIEGASSFSTILTWTPASGTALTVQDSLGDATYTQGVVSDLTLYGSGLTNTATGISVGDSNTGHWADRQNFNHVRVANFNIGVVWGHNAWSTTISESVITNNNTGLSFPIGLRNSGETIVVSSTSIQNNAVMGMNLPGFADFYFYGSSCDYNLTCGTVNVAHFFGMHFEQGSGRMLTVAGSALPSVEVIGGYVVYTANKGSGSDIFYVNSANNPMFKISGTYVLIATGQSFSYLVNWNGSGRFAQLNITDIPYPGGNLGTMTNTPCTFPGCYIHDGSLGIYANNFNGGHVDTSGNALFNSIQTAGGSGAGYCASQGFPCIYGNAKGVAIIPGTLAGGAAPFYVTPGVLNGNSFQLGIHDVIIGGGWDITNSNLVPKVGTPMVGQVACIKAAGPPVVIGYCSTTVSASGACTCN